MKKRDFRGADRCLTDNSQDRLVHVQRRAERYRGRARRAQAALDAIKTADRVDTPEPLEKPRLGGLGQLISWIEDTLIVPTGPMRGEPFRVAPWQASFLLDALSPGVRESGLSIARKNGKTSLIGALLLAHLVGPLRSVKWRCLVVSVTGHLARELRDAVEDTALASGLSDLIRVRKSPAPGSIDGLDGARVTILASDKATGHAVGADLAVIDEAGLIPESGRELWNAVLSSISGRDGRLLALGVRGRGPMFAELRERRDTASVVWHEYAAEAGAALDDRSAWEVANPGLADGIKSTSYMSDASARAIASPADAASFRALDLNQPVEAGRTMIVDVDDWAACTGLEQPPRDGPVVLGFDAGYSASMTALSALWPNSGRLEVYAALPSEPDLISRGRADGVGGLYETMRERGELSVYPGRVTPVDRFLLECVDALGGSDVAVLGADRVRRAEVEQALSNAGLNWPIEWRGTGASATADGSHDVRAFQRIVLRGDLHSSESLMMASAIAESELRWDSAGNPALDKSRHKARIDALQATVIAAGLAEIWAARQVTRAPAYALI